MDSRLPQPPKLRSSLGFLNIIGPVFVVRVRVRRVVPGPPKVCKEMAFMAVIMGLGLGYYFIACSGISLEAITVSRVFEKRLSQPETGSCSWSLGKTSENLTG